MAREVKATLSAWTCQDVADWLTQEGFSEYSDLLCRQHKIDGPTLLALSEDDLKQPPIKMTVLGDIKRLMSKINKLRIQDPDFEVGVFSNGLDVMQMLQKSQKSQSLTAIPSKTGALDEIDGVSSSTSHSQLARRRSQPRYQTSFSQDLSIKSRSLDTELWKTFLSFVYVFAVFLLTAFVMVIVHDRVPDMQKYPPLPDIFLDNMPYVPWAFAACELTGVILVCMWCGTLFFHKHRFILLRRMFSLMGTVYLLRCITMLITSLSVPGRHLHCVGKRYGDMWSRVQRTFEIWKGLGMTLQGVKSCGDYMFSGHTVIITTLNFFITEYTPSDSCYYLHLASWVLNIFGIFFILAAHEHYSIDVFIAFYLTSRLFMYYHTLANNRSLMQQDARRTRIWFPMFSFFESHCDGAVPNEYEWPQLTWPKLLKNFLPGEKWVVNHEEIKVTNDTKEKEKVKKT
ncbi:sphingomyelin synthase-related protein 1-like isoform X2 [Littorina saxatilis]|uniref:SAM domain-containing protein n=1 Tax=Littorina saxatilis TaxID=31220 RepID=A0AAN9BTU7_9CAEN